MIHITCTHLFCVSNQVGQALKTYDSKTPERWDRISEAVPGRSKKDCMKRYLLVQSMNLCSWTFAVILIHYRYKELAEIVKAKKAAALAAAKKS